MEEQLINLEKTYAVIKNNSDQLRPNSRQREFNQALIKRLKATLLTTNPNISQN